MFKLGKREILDSLYSEELESFYENIQYKTEKHKKPSWLKKTAMGLLFSFPFFFGSPDKDYIGPKEAKAEGKGYIAVSWCHPDPDPDVPSPQYYKIFAIRQDNGQTIVRNVPASRLRYNFTGLDEGVVYEIRAQSCIINSNGEEMCSEDSANRPLGTARLYGNADVSSVSPTINRVDSYDSSKCYSVYTGRITEPAYRQVCDFNGDYSPDMTDYNYYLRPNYGKVQANPLGSIYEDCSGGRCPETGTCNQPY